MPPTNPRRVCRAKTIGQIGNFHQLRQYLSGSAAEAVCKVVAIEKSPENRNNYVSHANDFRLYAEGEAHEQCTSVKLPIKSDPQLNYLNADGYILIVSSMHMSMYCRRDSIS